MVHLSKVEGHTKKLSPPLYGIDVSSKSSVVVNAVDLGVPEPRARDVGAGAAVSERYGMQNMVDPSCIQFERGEETILGYVRKFCSKCKLSPGLKVAKNARKMVQEKTSNLGSKNSFLCPSVSGQQLGRLSNLQIRFLFIMPIPANEETIRYRFFFIITLFFPKLIA